MLTSGWGSRIGAVSGTCVIYLAWGPLGAEPVRRFAASYSRHPPGADGELLLALKPPFTGDLPEEMTDLASALGGQVRTISDKGLDLASYRDLAASVPAEQFVFLNTVSEVLHAGWLRLVQDALDRPAVGLAGCTGTWESAFSAAPRPLKPALWRHYQPFPNPHVRTNAFGLRREVLERLGWPPVARKRTALRLESGRHGLSHQVRELGLRTVVCGADGRLYDPPEWPTSQTFRSGEQENLLLADNRTRQYLEATPAERRRLAAMAWGAAAAG